MFRQHNIHEYIWTATDGKTHNQIDHVLIGKRRHSNIFTVPNFREADIDTDRYLVVAKDRERLQGTKQAAYTFDMEILKVEVKLSLCLSNALRDLNDVDWVYSFRKLG
jgi:hypothetical protein